MFCEEGFDAAVSKNRVIKVLLSQIDQKILCLYLLHNKQQQMANRIQQFFSKGSNQLKENLNEDIYQSKFIKNGLLKWIFRKLTEASTTVVSFVLIYLASTRQLENLDLINYFKQNERRHIFIIIGVLTLFCYAEDKFGEGEDSKFFNSKAEQDNGKKDKDTPSGNEGAWKRMAFELASDFLRIVNYGLVFYVLEKDVFESTTNSHLIITRYALMLLWVLFTARKIIFWVCILILQFKDGSVDLGPWETSYQIQNKVGKIEEEFNETVKKLVTLASAKELLDKKKK